MTAKVNGTEAKEVALYFLDMTTDGRYMPATVSKTIAQVKALFNNGYSKDEVIQVIDRVTKKNSNIYSFGYINASIVNVMREIKQEEKEKREKEEARKIREEQAKLRTVVKDRDDTKERNKGKARELGVQRRLGEKFNFDMFEQQREDN